MSQSSLGWEVPEEDNADALPLRAEDRASTNLRSPAFQDSKPSATVADAAASSRAMPTQPEPSQATPEPAPAPVPRSQSVGTVQEMASGKPEGYAPRNAFSRQFARDEERRQKDFLSNVGNADPYQANDGRWKKLHADPLSGSVQEIDVDAAGLYKTDPATGTKLMKTSAGYVPIGTDEVVAGRAALLEERRQLRLQQALDEQSAAETKAKLEPVNDALKAYGKTPQQFEQAIELTRKGIDPAKPDPKAAERLATLEKKYQEWRAQNPEYAQAKQQFDNLHGQVSGIEDGRRARARTILDNMVSEDYIRRTGTLPPQKPVAPVEPGGVDPAEINRIATEIATKNGLTQTAATRLVLNQAKQQGAVKVGNLPIDEALKRAKVTAPPLIDKTPAFDTQKEFWKGLWSHATTAGNAFMGGAASLGSGILSTVALGQKLFGGTSTDDSTAMQFAKSIDDYWTRGMDPEYADSTVTQLSQGVGSALTFLAPGGIAGKVLGSAGKGARATQFGIEAALGALTNGGQEFSQLKEQGVSDDEAIIGSLGAYVLGTTEPLGMDAVGLGKLYSKVNRATGGKLTKFTSALLREIAGNTVEETLQEGTQQLGSEAWEKVKGIGEAKDKTWTQIAGEAGNAALMGGLNGMLFSIFVGGAAHRDAKMMAGKYAAESPATAASYLNLHQVQQQLAGKIQTAADSGDPVAMAQAQDEALNAQSALHQTSGQLLAGVAAGTREEIARTVAPELDQQSAEQTLADSTITHFASIEMGRELRDVYLTPEVQAKLGALEQSSGAHPALSALKTDQLVGLRAVNDLRTVLTGGALPEAKARALVQLGLLEAVTDADGATRMKVTDDALPLLPPMLRKAIAQNPGKFHFAQTPGTPGNALHNLIQGGQQRVAQAAEAIRTPAAATPATSGQPSLPKAATEAAPAPQTDQQENAPAEKTSPPATGQQTFDVAATTKLPGSAGKSEERFTIAAADEVAAEKQARARLEKGGRTVTGIKITPTAAAPKAARAYTAEEMAGAVRKIWTKNRGMYEALGVAAPEVDDTLEAALAMVGSRLKINPRILADESASLTERGIDTLRWLREAMREELLHAVQLRAEEQAGNSFKKTYAALWNDPDLDPKLKEAAAQAYNNFDGLEDWQKGAEAVRMVMDARWKGTITERIFKAIENLVAYLKGIEPAAQKSELFRDTLARAEAVLAEALQQQPTKGGETQDEDETRQTSQTQQTQQTKGRRQDVLTPPIGGTGAGADTAGPTAPAPEGPLRLVTPTGNKVARARWRIIDADALLTSDKPGYNPELQRRNRGRAASKSQVADIEFNLDPERLGPSPTSDIGAPIVNAAGMVLSGNGRSMAIRNAYRNESKKSAAYLEYVKKMAAENGMEEQLATARNPVLVREITSYENTDETEFSDLSNRPAILGRSDVERALDDARLIEDNDLWRLFDPSEDGDVLVASNRDFNRMFVHLTNDGAELLKGTGAFTPELGVRIKRAVLAALMKDQPDAMEQVTTALERASDVGLRRQFDGVMAGAGRLLTLQRAKPEMDIAADLGRALRGAIEVKTLIKKELARNVDDALAQGSLIDRPGEAETLLTRAIVEATSAKAVRELLTDYAVKAENVDSGPTMFGDEVPTATKEDVLRSIVDRERLERERVNAAEDLQDAMLAASTTAQKAAPVEETPNTVTVRAMNANGAIVEMQETPSKELVRELTVNRAKYKVLIDCLGKAA